MEIEREEVRRTDDVGDRLKAIMEQCNLLTNMKQEL